MEKVIKVGDVDVRFKATGKTVALAEEKFRIDVLKEITNLQQDVEKGDMGRSMRVFKQLAYVMAKQANPEVPDDYLDWLDQFGMFDLDAALPDIVSLWNVAALGKAQPKKK